TQSFQLVNLGGQTLTGTIATTPPFAIQSGSPFSLPPGQTGLVLVTFAPTNAAAFTNLALFTGNDGGSTNLLTGLGLTPAQLAVSPPSLNFGIVAVGGSAQGTLALSNLGGAPITNGLASLGGGPFTVVSGASFSLAGFGSTNLA